MNAGGAGVAALPLPRITTLRAAERGWRTVDFISDLHLDAALPRTFAAWRHHLLETPADAVIILGDLFEVWVGDDAMHLPFEARCVSTLAEASTRRSLVFVCGNRDFLVGPALAQAGGFELLDEPVLLEAFGQRALLCHGDALCLDDTDYQAFRRTVRSAAWQQTFLQCPLAERQRIAAGIRGESEQRKHRGDGTWADADTATVEAWLAQAGADWLIHGHTHRPADHAVAGGRQRRVLSDWDLDDELHPRGEVLRWNCDGMRRVGAVAAGR